MNKAEIIDALQQGRQEFLKAIDGLSEEEMQEPGVTGEWSVKDILSHLSRWEAELVRMLWQFKAGEKATYPTIVGQDVDRLNAQWFREYHDRPFDRVLADFHAVRKATIRQVQGYTDRDLNDPKKYPDLGGEPLEEWIAGDSYRHEAEHEAQIRAWRKKKSAGRNGGAT